MIRSHQTWSQSGRRATARIWLSRFQRCDGDVGEVGELGHARSTRSRSRLTLEEVCVEETGRLTMASWSAKTSSRRTSESEMRGYASLKSRISTNLEGMSRIVDGVGGES